MKTKNILITTVLVVVLCLVYSTGVFAAAGDILFKINIGTECQSVPTIGYDGTIYISGSYYDIVGEFPDITITDIEFNMYAINTDGTFKWKFEIGDASYSPSFAKDGTIYFGSLDEYLYALNPDGILKWKFEVTGGLFHSTPAIEDDGTIYCGTHSGYLYALNPDGSEKWVFDTLDMICSSPTISHDGTVYFQSLGSTDVIHALNPNGTIKWSYMVPSAGFKTSAQKSASPVIGSDGTIYCGTRNYYLIALNPDGTEKWLFDTKSNSTLADATIGSDGIIYYPNEHGMQAINPDGSLKWQVKFLDGKIISDSESWLEAAIVDTLYNDDGTVKGILVELNQVEGSPLIDSEGTIYIADGVFPVENSTREQLKACLYAFNPDGIYMWSIEIMRGTLTFSPVMDSNGIIYLTTLHGDLYAIDSGTNAGPADSPWPMYGANQYHTNKVGGDTGPVIVEAEEPVYFALISNYPNPFNPETTIEFSLKIPGEVDLAVYNMAGQIIRKLITDISMTPGVHSVIWYGHDDNGQPVSSGIYFARLRMGNNIVAQGMMLVK